MKRLLFLLLVSSSHVVAGLVELRAVSPRDPSVNGTLRITHVDAELVMRGVVAGTQATMMLDVLAEPGQRMEGRLSFTLPQGCTLTGAALDIGDTMRPASITYQQAAKKAYDSVVSRMLDPCLIQIQPDGLVTVQIFPFQDGSPRKLRLEFAHLLKPDDSWKFPLSFAEPVPFHIRGDVRNGKKQGGRLSYRDERDWMVPVEKDTGPLLAHPDALGRWFFKLLLPPSTSFEAPKHLLVVADVSLLQSARDAAAERAWLERVLAKMQTGRVTLAAFSNVLHSTTEFAVTDGKCDELFAVMGALPLDGAPRPGVVDLSAVPADLTVVISTLAAPAGGGREPALPSAAPVWVMDSVSAGPSAAAQYFALQRGGIAFHPGRSPELSFQRRESMTGTSVQRLVRLPLPGGSVLLTGELTAERSDLVIDGRTRVVTRGRDTAGALLIAHQQALANFTRLAMDPASLSPESLRTGPDLQPYLIPATAFIVLEQLSDYQRFRIPLPPGMQAQNSEEDDRYAREGSTEFRQSLQRAPGTKGTPFTWMNRLSSAEKLSAISARRENLAKYYGRRTGSASSPDRGWWKKEDWWREIEAGVEKRRSELPLMAAQFASGDTTLILRARELQATRVQEVALFESITSPMYSGGPSLDPLQPFDSYFARGGASDPFAGPGFAVDAFASASGSADDSPPADPFASPDSGARGGSGAGSGEGPRTLAGGGPARPQGLPALSVREIIQRATALHNEGLHAEALRALTSLALPARREPAILLLLAWMLTEWNEPALAREVLEYARHTSIPSDAATRGLALLELSAGNKDAAKSLLASAGHDVDRRDLAALEGNFSAALRITLECANADADADLEIEGPDFELCSWHNPLPSFGGALSFDGAGLEPEDFVLLEAPSQPLKVRVRFHNRARGPLRVTLISNWGRPQETRRVLLFPSADPRIITVAEIPAAK